MSRALLSPKKLDSLPREILFCFRASSEETGELALVTARRSSDVLARRDACFRLPIYSNREGIMLKSERFTRLVLGLTAALSVCMTRFCSGCLNCEVLARGIVPWETVRGLYDSQAALPWGELEALLPDGVPLPR